MPRSADDAVVSPRRRADLHSCWSTIILHQGDTRRRTQRALMYENTAYKALVAGLKLRQHFSR